MTITVEKLREMGLTKGCSNHAMNNWDNSDLDHEEDSADLYSTHPVGCTGCWLATVEAVVREAARVARAKPLPGAFDEYEQGRDEAGSSILSHFNLDEKGGEGGGLTKAEIEEKIEPCPDWCDSKSGKHESDMVSDATHRCSGCRVCLKPTASAGETTKTARERAQGAVDKWWSEGHDEGLPNLRLEIEAAIKEAVEAEQQAWMDHQEISYGITARHIAEQVQNARSALLEELLKGGPRPYVIRDEYGVSVQYVELSELRAWIEKERGR